MREGLTITGTIGEANLEQYRIQACNRYFAGTVDVYALPGSPQNWADQLSGFRRTSEDRRLLRCGLSDPVRAGSLVELRFACVDTSGHVVLDLVNVPTEDLSGRSGSICGATREAHG
jgi:hypothetical protein